MSPIAPFALVAALLSAVDPGPTQDPNGESAGIHSIPELSLEVDLRGLSGLESLETSPGGVLAVFEGDLGRSQVRVQIASQPVDGNDTEPEDVTDFVAPVTLTDLIRASASGGKKRSRRTPPHQGRAAYLWPGPYGYVPYASINTTRVEITSDRIYESYVLGAVLEDRFYAVEVECRPPLEEAERELVHDFLQSGLRYEGPVRDHEWTEEEVRRRWVEEAPPEMHDELKKPVRTKHYIILGNSSGGSLFAKKMEECHKEIQKIYPFDEVPGRRLMPVFIFRTPPQYHDYLVKSGMSREQAQQTAGVAFSDLYASVYESPNDPVHIHEATHQIFKNRMRLNGGGSWFQEGLAEYMSTRSSERRAYAKGRAKRGSQVPFRQFFTLDSLIRGGGQDETKGSAAHNNYLQAASIIEFARESKFGKKRFQLFVQAVGSAPRGNLQAIEEALLRVYDVDVAGFEREWADYWN